MPHYDICISEPNTLFRLTAWHSSYTEASVSNEFANTTNLHYYVVYKLLKF